MAGSIRIATWNANGLLQHKSELEIFLKEQKIDVCLISETHFTNETYFKIFGFNIYHTVQPSNRARGGSAVIIRTNIKHFEEPKFSSESIQASTVNIQCKRHKLSVSETYSPPRHNIKEVEYIEFLRTLGNSFIAGGDFNAQHTHWCSKYTSAKGKELLHAGKSLGCMFLSSGSPSYWPTDVNRHPDIIDSFIIKGLSINYIKVESSTDLSSDHTPVILTLSDTIIYKEPSPSLTNNKTDWKNYSNYLEKNIVLNVPLKTQDQIENEAKLFTTQLQLAAKKNTSILKKIKPGINYSIEVKELVREKRKACRAWQKTRDPEKKTIFNNLN